MKKLISIAILSTLLVVFASGCSEGNRNEEFMPDIVEGGASITKAELIDAIWNEDGEVPLDLLCLVTSTFTIKSDNTFTIAKNGNPGGLNPAEVVIVSPINVEFDDPANDGRGPTCAPEAMLQYDINASEQEPIGIESATALRARHSLIHMVSGAHVNYPGCTIRAHFDKAGKAICDPDLIPDEEEDVVDDEESAEDEDADDDESADDEAEDDSADDDESADDDDIMIVTPIPGVFGSLSIKAQNVNEDGVPCGLEEIKTVRLVVDDYDCRLEGYTPRPLLY